MESNLLGEGEFLGTVRRMAAVAGVTLVETSYAPGCRLAEHAHTRPYFCLVVSGASVGRILRDDGR